MKKYLSTLAFIVVNLMAIYCQPALATCNNYKPLHTQSYLQGAHARGSCGCTSCHLGGFSVSTAPKTCIGCHMGQRNTAMQMNATHIKPINIACENCHNVNTFAGAKMNHSVVTTQACSTCHNKVNARGKPSEHIATIQECSDCHKTTSSWDAKMNHTGITTGCATCHANDKTRQANHIPTTESCETCHSSFTTWLGGKFNHAGIVDCLVCHGDNQIKATKKAPTHLATTLNCISCHDNTSVFSCAKLEIKFYEAIKYARAYLSTIFS